MNDDDFDSAIQSSLDANKAILMGKVDDLSKISDDQLKAIIPDTSASDTLNKLIAVVKDASQANTQLADVQTKISSLGDDAVKIAKLVGMFA